MQSGIKCGYGISRGICQNRTNLDADNAYLKSKVADMKWLEFGLLALGAVIGAYLRYRMVESPVTFFGLPVNVLMVNVSGSFILGLFSVLSLAFNLDSRYTLFMAIGFCGSYTTMSSFELETVNLMDNHRLGAAALDMAANVGFSFVAVILGRLLGTAVVERVF